MAATYLAYLYVFPSAKKYRYALLLPALVLIAYLNYRVSLTLQQCTCCTPNEWMYIVGRVLDYLTASLVFFMFYTFKKLYQKQQQVEKLQAEQRNAEIKGLKAQVQPHFLFNTLNMIYGHALKKDEGTPDLILKLSDNFRYMLHTGDKTKVTVKEEMEHLKDYIELQQMRLTDKVQVKWSQDIDNEEQLIPPLLLISFVENAFKYSSLLKGTNHPVQFAVSLNNGHFRFTAKNPYREQVVEKDEWQKSGIGLKNVKQRLEILYPDKHNLITKKDAGEFLADLTMEL